MGWARVIEEKGEEVVGTVRCVYVTEDTATTEIYTGEIVGSVRCV